MQYPPLPPGPDLNYLIHQVTPLAVLVLMFVGVRWVFRSPIGEALAERIRAGKHRRRHWKGFGGEWVDAPGSADDARVAALEEQVSQLHGQVTELAERLDFAERLLAERRERKLGAGQ